MAKKIMTCKAAPEIELCFDGGEAILLRFDIRCLSNIQELDGGLAGFLKKGIAEMAASIVYAAGKDINEDFDENKARELIANMSIDNITEIVKTFEESVGSSSEEETKKLIAQLLKNWRLTSICSTITTQSSSDLMRKASSGQHFRE